MRDELENKVYELVENGMSLNAVAKKLGIGKTTVHTIFHKIKRTRENRSEHSDRSERSDHSERSEHQNNENLTAKQTNNVIIDPLTNPLGSLLMNIPASAKLSGPFVELMELIPHNFRGIIESGRIEYSEIFAWKLAGFISRFYATVEIISYNLKPFDDKQMTSSSSWYTNIKLRRCANMAHVESEINRTAAKVIIINNSQSLGIQATEWRKLIVTNPNKAIIAIGRGSINLLSDLHFVARFNNNILKTVSIETKYGFIQDFYFDIGDEYYYKFIEK